MSSINPEFYAPYDYEAKVPKARHNLGRKSSLTCQTGELVPFWYRRVYVGDDFYVKPLSLLQSILPLNRPLLDCFELRIETYFCPLTNYYGWMDNNSRESTEDIMSKSTKWQLPLFGEGDDGTFEVLFENSDGLVGAPYLTAEMFARQRDDYRDRFVGIGSLMQYFGVPAGFTGNNQDSIEYMYADSLGNTVNLEPWLCYLDIIRSYHVNTQYESIPFLSGYGFSSNPDVGDVFVSPFSHQRLDDFFMALRASSAHRDFDGNIFTNSMMHSTAYNGPTDSFLEWVRLTQYRHGGFFCVQHRPDLWRNLLSVTNNSYTATVSVSNGMTTINEIRQKSHLQELADRVGVSGGRYQSLKKTIFGYTSKKGLHMPELLGVTRHLIDPSNITAMAETTSEDGTIALGQKASNVDKFNAGGKVRIRPTDDGYIMSLVSITPLVSYGQGFDPNAVRLNFADDFTPQMQRIGFEGIPRIFYSALPEVELEEVESTGEFRAVIAPGSPWNDVVGKQPKWLYERTDYNRVYGGFTPIFGEYSDMVLSRKYSRDEDVPSAIAGSYMPEFDLSPYVNPLDYNDIFALQGIPDDPWSLHITMQVSAKRPILKRWMPTLES